MRRRLAESVMEVEAAGKGEVLDFRLSATETTTLKKTKRFHVPFIILNILL